MTLTEFLLERIAEDERHARKLAESDRRPVLSLALTVNHPERILLECEAKRQIVELLAPFNERARWRDSQGAEALRTLALPYADHNDCREEWKP